MDVVRNLLASVLALVATTFLTAINDNLAQAAAMATTIRIQAFGKSLGVALNKDVLAKSGFVKGDEVQVEATPDRVVITRHDSDYAKVMDGFRKAAARYPGAMSKLAK